MTYDTNHKRKKGKGKKSGKGGSYNGTMSKILGDARPTNEPGFMAESGPHKSMDGILNVDYIGG